MEFNRINITTEGRGKVIWCWKIPNTKKNLHLASGDLVHESISFGSWMSLSWTCWLVAKALTKILLAKDLFCASPSICCIRFGSVLGEQDDWYATIHHIWSCPHSNHSRHTEWYESIQDRFRTVSCPIRRILFAWWDDWQPSWRMQQSHCRFRPLSSYCWFLPLSIWYMAKKGGNGWEGFLRSLCQE